METIRLLLSVGLGICFISMSIFIKGTRGWPERRPDRDRLQEAQVFATVAGLCLLASAVGALFTAEPARPALVALATLASVASLAVVAVIARMTEAKRLRDLTRKRALESADAAGRKVS